MFKLLQKKIPIQKNLHIDITIIILDTSGFLGSDLTKRLESEYVKIKVLIHDKNWK